MSDERSVPVISEDILSKWGSSIEEFKKKYAEEWDSMKLVDLSNTAHPDKPWCIVLHIIKEDVVLYLTKIDECYAFSQYSSNVDFWDIDECMKTVDFIRHQRMHRAPNMKGVVRAYNPYTKTLIQ